MSCESEKFFREFQKYADTQDIQSEDSLQIALEAFTAMYNSGLYDHQPTEPDAYDYLDMAYSAKTKPKTVEYAQKALELDPELLEAEFLLISAQAKADSDYQADLEALLKKGEMQLWGKGITRQQNAGDYYALHETRPYLRVYQSYVDFLVVEGKLRKAAAACQDILYLNENDNLGMRYTLMVLYALLEERESAEELYQKYPEHSAFTLLPFIALYYRLDDTAKATEWLTVLTRHKKGIKTALKELNKMDAWELDDLSHASHYSPGSTEEIQLAYASHLNLYGTLPDLLPWMISHLPPARSAKKRNPPNK
jgi:hypothetical protein